MASSSPGSGSRPLAAVLVVLGVLLAVVLAFWVDGGKDGGSKPAPAPTGATVQADQIRLADLPVEARRTVAAIEHGGPYPYARDGATFRNLEGRLPPQPTGYYHEYTVPTPGSPDRGARRIVLGAGGELYWSPDHYRTFRTILGAEAVSR